MTQAKTTRRIGVTALAAASAVVPLLATSPADAATTSFGSEVSGASTTANADGSYTVSWTDAQASAQVDIYASTNPSNPQWTGTLVDTTTATTANITGLAAGQRWYFDIVPTKDNWFQTGVETAAQSIGLQGAPNARDIGGYVTSSGLQVRYGQVFRTNSISKLTATDQTTLTDLGVTTDYDFRSPTEVAANGPDAVPAGVNVVSAPIYDPANDFYTWTAKVIAGGPAAQQAALGNGQAAQIMQNYYQWLITDPTARGQLASVLTGIADSTGPVVFHCTAGKDRTGVETALLLTILGVPQGTVMSDYLASNQYLATSNAQELGYLESVGLVKDPTLLEPILGVQASYLQATFAQINSSYGNFWNFVLSKGGLALSPATVAKLQLKLLQLP